MIIAIVHSLSLFHSLQPHGLQHVKLPCPLLSPEVCSDSCPLMLPNYLTIIQFSSVAQLCPTLCDPMDCSTPGFPVHHQLPVLAQTNVHQVGDAIQPTHPFIPFFSCLQSFPASGSFPMSQFFAWGGQSIGASTSASVLPMNIQDWFPLGLAGLISLQSKGLSRVFSNTTVQRHQFFGTQPTLWSSSLIHHGYWKNHSCD